MNVMIGRTPGYDGQITTIEPIRDPDGEGKRDVQYVGVRYDSIGRLYKQEIIEKHHWEAACQLQRDAERAEIITRANMGGVRAPRSSYATSDTQDKARASAYDAKRSVEIASGRAGTLGELILRLIVLHNHTMVSAARIAGISRNDVPTELRRALNTLARHYGFSS